MYAICNLSIVPMRAEPSDKSELVSQVLFGELFQVLEEHKNWLRIQMAKDEYMGWIDKKQCMSIDEEVYLELLKQQPVFCGELIDAVYNEKDLLSVPLGAELTFMENKEVNVSGFRCEGMRVSGVKDRNSLMETASKYLNAPYLWGGRTPFGIDCSGFTQMVYALSGYQIPRDAKDQAKIGSSLSFIEECETGDLAFFDNEEGNIIHTGIVIENNYIIHAHGRVRIDRLDHLGILNVDTGVHSHKLRILKKIIP